MTLTHPVPGSPVRIWNDRLQRLLGVLTTELQGEAGTFAEREYRGRRIGLTIQEDGRRLVRISRDDRPSGIPAWTRWQVEVDGIRQHMGIAHWPRHEVADQSTVAWYIEPTVIK